MLRKLESLEIKDGKIILKVRAKTGATRPEAGGKAASQGGSCAFRSERTEEQSLRRTVNQNRRRQPNRTRSQTATKKS